jgi:hypothetical protein
VSSARRVASNLLDGAFWSVFAVDEITEDLERAVEYLNGPVPRGPPHDLSCRWAGPDGTAPVGTSARPVSA